MQQRGRDSNSIATATTRVGGGRSRLDRADTRPRPGRLAFPKAQPGALNAATLALLLACALALRVWGITFGLPYLYHPDEPAYVLQALALARGLPDGLNGLNGISGISFANPPLYKDVLLGVYAVTFGLGRLAHVYTSQQDFIAQFRANPTLLYLLARAASAFFGALTVLATWWLGRNLRSARTGLIAACLAAVTYLLVRESHFGVNDALVTLCVTCGCALCVQIARDGSPRTYVAAGVILGLAFSAKYQGAILLLPLLVAHLWRHPTRRSRDWRPETRRARDLVVALAAALASTLLTFPSLMLEPTRVLQDIYVHLYVPSRTGYDGLDPAGGYVFYTRTLVLGLGLPLLLCACAGAALGVVRRDRGMLVVGSVPLALFALLGSSEMYFARFLLPAIPPLVALGAVLLDEVVCRYGRALFAALTGLIVLGTAPNALRFDALLTQTDTRTQARAWVGSQLPAGARVAVDSAPLGPTLDGMGQDVLVVNDFALFDHSLDEYRRLGVQYVIVSSFVSDIPVLDPSRDARRRAFSTTLAQSARLVAQFRPYADDHPPPLTYDQIYAPFDSLASFARPGPSVSVYQLNTPE